MNKDIECPYCNDRGWVYENHGQNLGSEKVSCACIGKEIDFNNDTPEEGEEMYLMDGKKYYNDNYASEG